MRKSFLLCFVIMLIMPLLLAAQMLGNVAGKITDEEGQALESASIMIPALEMGTYSRANGSFYLKDIPAGEHEIHVRLMGHSTESAIVEVRNNETTVQNFSLINQALEVEGFSVNATRAIERKTPVSFSNVDSETIQQKYTTGDMPQMLDDIPGLFSTTSGLGEAEITMRGFDANKIQILINGIPVNDPESQVVYWSNWTGLSSNVKNVQVQRGAGASLYGSGAFGGSVNIETMGTETNQHFSLRTSAGLYTTDGKSATSFGEMEEYTPFNYNIQLKYSSGKLFNNKFRYDITAERKAGDYYIRGTEYDGWSFGFETENKVGTHVINSSFIVSPQAHNQARSTYDRELGKFLGREFNFTNHPWQENTYVKPQLSFRDKWTISPQTNVMTNLFITTGKGGGSYANNIIFDAESGALLYQPLNSVDVERRNFARHAYKIYQETGYLIEGMEIIDHGAYQEGQFTWEGETETVYSGSDFYTNQHTWKYKSYNNHQQFGLNTYFDHEFSDYFSMVLGAESRYWKADHYKEGSDFRYYQPSSPDSVSTLGAFVRDYDYTTDVLNTSGFVRSKIEIPFDSYIQNINLMLDGQYAVYYSEVNENLLQYYDFMKDEFIGDGFYATKTDSILVWQHDAAGDSTQVIASKFSADDYTRTFDFFSPKMGINVNLDDNWNVLANYSIVYKEPRVGDWYDRYNGPGVNQIVDGKAFELNPEKGETFEVGAGYRNDIIKSDITFYHTKFTDKIENITDQHGDSKTINAGNATHQGIELSLGGEINNFDANSSATFSRNRWGDLNLQNIFYESAEDVEGKVVPYSPEQMASASLGYTFQDMPLMGSLRLGLSGKWSDEYYSTYDNVYVKQEYYYDEAGNFQSIGEHEFVTNADGEGAYDYDPATETYTINGDNVGDYDREWIYSSSKLPTFFELNGSISYKFYLGSHETSIKLNINNILNKKDNYSKAYIRPAYGMKLKREDEDGNVSWDDPTFGEGATGGNSTGGGHYPYLSPAPLLNLFLTMEIKF